MVDLVALLDRAPGPVRRAIARIVIGRGVLGKLVDALRFRYSPTDVPPLPAATAAAVRVAIGPANSAGQGFQWARALERNLSDVDPISVMAVPANPFRPDVDLDVPIAVFQRSREWQSAFEAFLTDRTHVIWESGRPLLGRAYDSEVSRELDVLGRRGVARALLFHGSDIRPPSRHAADHPWSPFRDPSSGPVRMLEAETARNLELVASAGVPVFVSTPDLLQWLPDAVWCPVVVEPDAWRRAATGARRAGLPLVVHAPSHPWLKGTNLVEPIVRRLADEGVIEYRRIVGVPHAEMASLYAEADIVLDQFVLGIYGVATCEALAAGRLVMSHVDRFTRDAVREHTGLDLPVHETTVETLEAELRRAAADPGAFEGLRSAGVEFVEAVHDGRRSAEAMAPFLGVSA